MPEINVNVEVYCTCGEGLCNQTESRRTHRRAELCFVVAPCEKCLGRANAEGHSEGYNEGYDEGVADSQE
mgnify:CR=1 FL=1